MLKARGRTGSYRPDLSISSVMPEASSDCDAPWCTCDPAGMRSSTIRFASALFAARRTVIPFASSAAAVRVTRASSAGAANRLLKVLSRLELDFGHATVLPTGGYTCICKHPSATYLYMQEHFPATDAAALFGRLVEESLPGRRGEPAWRALLQAHATLMRQLDTDLREHAGLPVADFDVLAQLAVAGGELRMTGLAARTLLSRSGLTRRIARLVDDGLVRRANATEDGRGVVVALTDAGVARLTETVPVHLRGVSKLFVERLDDHELAVLESALRKVIVDCTFG